MADIIGYTYEEEERPFNYLDAGIIVDRIGNIEDMLAAITPIEGDLINISMRRIYDDDVIAEDRIIEDDIMVGGTIDYTNPLWEQYKLMLMHILDEEHHFTGEQTEWIAASDMNANNYSHPATHTIEKLGDDIHEGALLPSRIFNDDHVSTIRRNTILQVPEGNWLTNGLDANGSFVEIFATRENPLIYTVAQGFYADGRARDSIVVIAEHVKTYLPVLHDVQFLTIDHEGKLGVSADRAEYDPLLGTTVNGTPRINLAFRTQYAPEGTLISVKVSPDEVVTIDLSEDDARPTINETFTADIFYVDIDRNHGDSAFVGFRQINFYGSTGVKIALTEAAILQAECTGVGSDNVQCMFLTDGTLIGPSAGNSLLVPFDGSSGVRIGIKFSIPLTISRIDVHNFVHNVDGENVNTDRGADVVEIGYGNGTVTAADLSTYRQDIPGQTVLFYGAIKMHPGTAVPDPQTIKVARAVSSGSWGITNPFGHSDIGIDVYARGCAIPTDPDAVDIVTSDTFVFDCANNHGSVQLGLRNILPIGTDGKVIDITAGQIAETWLTSHALAFDEAGIFQSDTIPYTGAWGYAAFNTNQRLVVRYTGARSIIGFRIQNFHSNGADVNKGVRDIKVYAWDMTKPRLAAGENVGYQAALEKLKLMSDVTLQPHPAIMGYEYEDVLTAAIPKIINTAAVPLSRSSAAFDCNTVGVEIDVDDREIALRYGNHLVLEGASNGTLFWPNHVYLTVALRDLRYKGISIDGASAVNPIIFQGKVYEHLIELTVAAQNPPVTDFYCSLTASDSVVFDVTDDAVHEQGEFQKPGDIDGQSFKFYLRDLTEITVSTTEPSNIPISLLNGLMANDVNSLEVVNFSQCPTSVADDSNGFYPPVLEDNFGALDKLTELRLKIDADTFPASVGELRNLRSLYLDTATRKALFSLPSTLSGCEQLTHLSCTSCLSGSLPPESGDISNLEVLIFDSNLGLSGSSPVEWMRLVALRELTIRNSPFFTFNGTAETSMMASLEKVLLENIQVRFPGTYGMRTAFEGCVALKEIYLTCPNSGFINLGHGGGFGLFMQYASNLEKCHIQQAQFNTDLAPSVGMGPKLELRITNTNLTNFMIDEPRSTLEIFCLRDNPNLRSLHSNLSNWVSLNMKYFDVAYNDLEASVIEAIVDDYYQRMYQLRYADELIMRFEHNDCSFPAEHPIHSKLDSLRSRGVTITI